MLENYLNIITNMENYVDGILVVDANADIVYMHKFNEELTPFAEKEAIGKNLFTVYPTMNPEESTVVKALRTGEETLAYEGTLTTAQGKSFKVIDDTFPIREDGKVIGAVCITHSLSRTKTLTSLNITADKEQTPKDLYTLSDIIGRSTPVQTLRQQIQRVSKTSSSLLIYGETGTGKEMVAQSVHSGSPRKGKPFITQNCAAIPATLLESIFFGAVKGSYTGAENHAGIFEVADGGTVFLDEINSMDMGLQAKLLRVLEEKKVTRIGSTESRDVDVRIIAAINRPPLECIKNGTLRADLFYRLGSVTLNIPPLRERQGDVGLLTKYFVDEYKAEMHKNIIGVSHDVMKIFQTYFWPGNVRELKNVIEGAFNLCDSTIIGIGDLPAYMLTDIEVDMLTAETPYGEQVLSFTGNLKDRLDAYEKTMIVRAIEDNKTLAAAAESLGISRQSLNQKLHKYDLSVKKGELTLESF